MRAEFELVKARGVREKEYCWDKVAWPRKVSDGQCFGLSTEDRTYYFYAESEDEARYIGQQLILTSPCTIHNYNFWLI